MNQADAPQFDRLQRRSLMLGVAALVACAAGAVISRPQFFQAYLIAYLFWTGIALGCLGILMLHHLVGGNWGFVIQRLLESGTRTLPLLALLFLPLLFGLRDLYLWSRPEAVAADELLQHKGAYLNGPFFAVRTLAYFAVWIGIGSLLAKWSAEQDRTAAPGLTRRLQLLSGPGLGLFGLTASFAAIDWVMSLEPHWYSSIYGVVFLVGHVLAALSFAIVAVILLAGRQPLSGVISSKHLHDLGNLLLAFVMFWAYIAFSQFLIIWSGNLAEEIPWYLRRMAGGWGWIAALLILCHFAVPFLLLLSRVTKQRAHILFVVAAGILCMRLVDLFWIVAPAVRSAGFRVHWLDVMAPVGLGGIWLAAFLWHLKRRPLLPLHDPRFAATPEARHG
jgi:hypothetical protein